MSSNELDPEDDQVRWAISQASSILPKLLKLQAHMDSGTALSEPEGAEVEQLSRHDITMMMDIMQILHPDLTELGRVQALGLSAKARMAISDFDRLGDIKDLEEAIDCLTQFLSLTSDSYMEQHTELGLLGMSLCCRFECLGLGNLADVNQGIEYLGQAVLLTPDIDSSKPAQLGNLGTAYLCRFGRLGELADVDKAIEYQTQASLRISDGDACQAGYLNNLGNAYQGRFERLGNITDADRAIECRRKAVMLTPDSHADKPGYLNSLGISYISRFDQLGELADLEQAIVCDNQAMILTHDSHPQRSGCLNNLGNAHLSRFERLGKHDNMDKAIQFQSKAVLLTPDNHVDKPSFLMSLGRSYQYRFNHLSELTDINKAIDCTNQAMRLIPGGHAQEPQFLSVLGYLYVSRCQHLHDIADIDMGIECISQAVLLTPDGHVEKPAYLRGLGISYLCRFRSFDKDVAVDEETTSQTPAAPHVSHDRSETPLKFNGIGFSAQVPFVRSEKILDQNGSIGYLVQGLLLTPDGSTIDTGYTYHVGGSPDCPFKDPNRLAALELSQSFFQRPAQHIVTCPESQVSSSCMWASLSLLLGLTPEPAYKRCMELIPHLIWVGTTIEQRYSLLTQISDLATEAAAWAISVELYDLAIEWLEEGRSIVWNQILQLRTPFDDLSAEDAVLAQRLGDVAGALESAGSRLVPTVSARNSSSDPEKEAQRHRLLAMEWEELIGKAREIPGFHNFMRRRKAADLKLAATDGPVVLINTHRKRCDALIILPQCDDIVHLPLENFSLEKANEARTLLDSLVCHLDGRAGGFKRSNPQPKAEDMFKRVLVTLWSDIVKPVLDILACTHEMPADKMPHITWCTTGALSFLPLHAAGCYNGLQPNAFDMIISSYTPTLSALLSPAVQSSGSCSGVLAVGQQYTQGLCPLPNTMQELSAIKAHAHRTQFKELNGDGATVNEVLNAMDEYGWVHFACHATQNPTNPAHSAFRLHDGNLTLEMITKQAFKNKGLAFLSACQTATGDNKLPDEAIHLAAGMLMAGYPSVIGTMWSIYDEDAPEVARQVYAEMLKDGNMDHKGAARALHKAVACLRDRVGHDAFLQWVPFIHIGA